MSEKEQILAQPSWPACFLPGVKNPPLLALCSRQGLGVGLPGVGSVEKPACSGCLCCLCSAAAPPWCRSREGGGRDGVKEKPHPGKPAAQGEKRTRRSQGQESEAHVLPAPSLDGSQGKRGRKGVS